MNINSDLVSQPNVNVDMLDKKTQITVLNSEKMYNLITTVMYKQQTQAAERLAFTESKKQIVLGQLLKRQ